MLVILLGFDITKTNGCYTVMFRYKQKCLDITFMFRYHNQNAWLLYLYVSMSYYNTIMFRQRNQNAISSYDFEPRSNVAHNLLVKTTDKQRKTRSNDHIHDFLKTAMQSNFYPRLCFFPIKFEIITTVTNSDKAVLCVTCIYVLSIEFDIKGTILLVIIFSLMQYRVGKK